MKIKDKVRAKAPAVVEPPTGVESTQSDAPKKKIKFNRRTLFKIMFVISIIFIMISLTYAWFSLSETGVVGGLDIGVTDPNNLIAGGIKFEGIVDSIAGDGTSFFKPIMEKQLVGTRGDYNLYKNVNSGKYYDLEDDVESETAVVKNLYIQDFTLSINGKHNIYNMVLVNNSYLSALIYYLGLGVVLLLGYIVCRFVNKEKYTLPLSKQ